MTADIEVENERGVGTVVHLLLLGNNSCHHPRLPRHGCVF